jgi:DNA-binding MarR family transcriptional regulator
MSMDMLAQVLRFSNPLVSRAEHKLLMILAYHTNHDTGLAYPGRRLLAQELLITERHVKRLVQGLVKAGWLEVKPGQGRGHLSVYRIKVPPDEVIHRKGDMSRRRPPRKGDIFAHA